MLAGAVTWRAMERVGVLVHPTRPVRDAVDVLRGWTAARGLDLVQLPVGEQPSVAPTGEVSECDVIIALGGDGTVLKALHAAASTRTPVLGVAYGSLGALTSVPQDHLRAGLEQFADGGYASRRLPALSVESNGERVGAAINDVVLARRGGTQLSLDIYVADELYVRMAGDGVVLSTPLGSSAYSMAAGGPLLGSGVDAVLCTPLAMHGGSAPPLVVPHDRSFALEVHPGHGGYGLQIDGWWIESDAEGFLVRCQSDYTTLVELTGSDGGLTWLRDRGLISDSPRVLAQQHREDREP
jgi:NAD+ kinase